MSDISQLKNRLEKISRGGDFKTATKSLTPLLQHVHDFVEMVREEQELAGLTSQYSNNLVKLPKDDPDYPEKQREMQELLRAAEKAKRHISDKRTELRRVGEELQKISSDINRIL